MNKTEPLHWRDSLDNEGHRNISRQIKIQNNIEANIYEVSTMCHACELSHFSRVQLFVTLWNVALKAPLSRGFSRQAYRSG